MNKQERIEKIKSGLKNLVQNKNKTEKELLAIAEKKYSEEQFDLDSLVTNPQERQLAKKILRKYLDAYDIQRPAEKADLSQLIYLSVLHLRLTKILNDENKESKGKAAPLKLIETMHKNIEQMSQLKKVLGLRKTEEDEKKDPLKELENMKQRAEKYITNPENRDRFEFKCPDCGEITLLWRETKGFTLTKHPLILRGTTFYNKGLFDLVRNKKITAKELADAFEIVSEDYIIRCLKEIKE